MTGITKVGLEKLGFEMTNSHWHVIYYAMGDQSKDHLKAEYWNDDDIQVFAVRKDGTRIPFRNLKTIEQLKTLIDVCL